LRRIGTGQVTTRQKVRLLSREAPWIGGCMAVCLVIGIGSAAAWISLGNGPFGVIQEIKLDRDLSFLPYVEVLALLGFFFVVVQGWNLVVDLRRGGVQMHVGRMEVLSGRVRMLYRASGRPPSPVFEMSSDGQFVIGLRGSEYAHLHARVSGAFDCITYRTADGLRILSVELRSTVEASSSPNPRSG
jgi:hypothetical protein